MIHGSRVDLRHKTVAAKIGGLAAFLGIHSTGVSAHAKQQAECLESDNEQQSCSDAQSKIIAAT